MTPPIPDALIDADVVASTGPRRDIQSLALRGLIVAHWSPWIVEEATRAIAYNWYRRYGFTDAARRALSTASKPAMRALTATFRAVDPKPPYRLSGLMPIRATTMSSLRQRRSTPSTSSATTRATSRRAP